jgi:hypothetical protein
LGTSPSENKIAINQEAGVTQCLLWKKQVAMFNQYRKKLPKVNIDASQGSMSYLDFLAMWCGIPSLCMQEGMSLF